MYKSFRPGDIVLARVLTSHTQTYLLSTAENELGVVFAKSEAGKKVVYINCKHKGYIIVMINMVEMKKIMFSASTLNSTVGIKLCFIYYNSKLTAVCI